MGTWYGRVARLNYHWRGISSEAKMDWLGTHVETQTHNAESKLFTLKFIRSRKQNIEYIIVVC